MALKLTLVNSILLAIAGHSFSGSDAPRLLTFSETGKLESAKLYGNISQYAYWFVDMLVGTPPQRASVIVDTGSTVCGFSCNICKSCGEHIDSAFDISASTTANWATCSERCPTGSCTNGHCSYSLSYTEGSSVHGYWFSDFVQLGDLAERNLPVLSSLGCHVSETKLFFSQSVNGILGMAPRSAGTFPTILGSLFSDSRINKYIFSLCLAHDGGELVVGGFNSTFNQEPVKWVPMWSQGFYTLELTRVSIGTHSIGSQFGRTIVDSGTTLVYFSPVVFKALSLQIDTLVSLPKHNSRCWKTLDPSRFPIITFEFGSILADWDPSAYLHVSSGNVLCYAFDAGSPGETILGASWMIGRNVVFDQSTAKFGMAKANCPSYTERPSHEPGTLTTLTSTSPAPATSVQAFVTFAAVVPTVPVADLEDVNSLSNSATMKADWNDSSASEDSTSSSLLPLAVVVAILAAASGLFLIYRRRKIVTQYTVVAQVQPSAPPLGSSINDIESQRTILIHTK